MDSLANLLASKEYSEPDEMAALKAYVQATYQSVVEVQIRGNSLLLMVRSAALASQLRLDMLKLQKAAKTTKRITIIINN